MTVQNRLAPGKYKLTVEDYEALAATGAFGGMRTELIDGDIIVMAPEYRPHAFVRDTLAYRLQQQLERLGSDLHASSGSVRLADNAMPQPDIVLTSEPMGQGPIPGASVALLVEVSSTTLPADVSVKTRLYAAAAIAEYWIVDVSGRIVLQLWGPEAAEFTDQRVTSFGDDIASTTVSALTISTAGL